MHLLSFQLMPGAVGGGREYGGVAGGWEWSIVPAVGWWPVVLSADAKSSWRWEGIWGCGLLCMQ